MSLNEHRLKREPLEARFLRKFRQVNRDDSLLEYLLSDETNRRKPISDRDRDVAESIAQWLGSHVGQSYLESCRD